MIKKSVKAKRKKVFKTKRRRNESGQQITNSARKRGEKQKANGRQVLFIRTENECGNKDKGEKLYSGELFYWKEKHTRYADTHSGKRSV